MSPLSIVVRMHHTGRRRSQEAAALSLRKDQLARLLRSRSEGIFIAPFETGEIGPDLFRHACKLGLEGWSPSIVRVAYRAGRFGHWIKVKNRRIRRLAGFRIGSEAPQTTANWPVIALEALLVFNTRRVSAPSPAGLS